LVAAGETAGSVSTAVTIAAEMTAFDRAALVLVIVGVPPCLDFVFRGSPQPQPRTRARV
jgi:hypothetical protein